MLEARFVRPSPLFASRCARSADQRLAARGIGRLVDTYIYIYIYGRFPRPATTKVAKARLFDERNEESIPYESNENIGVQGIY